MLNQTYLPTVSFGVILNAFDELCGALARVTKVLRKCTVCEIRHAGFRVAEVKKHRDWNQETQDLVVHSLKKTERPSVEEIKMTIMTATTKY